MNFNQNITKKRKTDPRHMLVFLLVFFVVYNVVIFLLWWVLRCIGKYWYVLGGVGGW